MATRSLAQVWLIAAAVGPCLASAASAGVPAGAEVRRGAVDADVAAASTGDSLGLLQFSAGSRVAQNATAAGSAPPAEGHYWPHARGDVGRYGQTPYKIPMDFDKRLAWKWDSPEFNTILWGTLFDTKKNIYVAGGHGIFKFSPDGKMLWQSGLPGSEMPTLADDKLICMQMIPPTMYALDLETGEILWQKMLGPLNGAHGDFVEVYKGVAVVGTGGGLMASGGGPTLFAAGVDVDGGETLWKFQPDCGLWNIMALFPDEETTVFNDMCGNVYRLGRKNGTLIWKSPGSVSFTDGGSMIGPDGDVYTCSSKKFTWGTVNTQGVLRKHRLSDGSLAWRKTLDYPCVNFPTVSADGRSVIVAPGALSDEAKTKEVASMPEEEKYPFFQKQIGLCKNNTQREYYGMANLEGAIMAFDTETGDLQWRHDVYPYGGIAFAGDEGRAWLHATDPVTHTFPHCWPSHWSAPTVDPDGKVFIGRSTGQIIAYDPKTDKETSFQTDDGALMGGAGFAPGMMAITTCSSVYVFHTDE